MKKPRAAILAMTFANIFYYLSPSSATKKPVFSYDFGVQYCCVTKTIGK